MKKSTGFTMLELMVTIAIVAIVASVGIPAMNSFLNSSQAEAKLTELSRLMAFARSQASSSKTPVTICPLTAGSCTSNWGNRISVFNDLNNNRQLDNGEVELRVVEASKASDSVNFAPAGVTFLANGTTNTSGTLNYCPSGKAEYGAALILLQSGRSRVSRDGVTCA